MTAKPAQESDKDQKDPETPRAEGLEDQTSGSPEVSSKGEQTIQAGPPSQEVQKPYVPLKNLTPTQELTHAVVKDTLTKNELLRRIRLLNDFLSFTLFSPQGQAIRDLRERIKTFFEGHQGNKAELDLLVEEADWLNSLSPQFFSKFTRENFNVVFDELEKELVATVPVIIYLPFFMPDVEQKQVGEWLKKNISDTLLFETTYDPNLIGGCSFSFKGVTKDYSIHARIEANRQKIIEDLKGFKKVQ